MKFSPTAGSAVSSPSTLVAAVATLPFSKQCALSLFRSFRSVFMDQQSLKVQEEPQSIPAGEMPRTIIATVDRGLTGDHPARAFASHCRRGA